MSSIDWLGAAAAAIPGVLVALLSDFLSRQRTARQTRQANQNARALLALEIEANLTALQSFWQTINDLDKQDKEAGDNHLGQMAYGGLITYSLPRWSTTHWEHFSPSTGGALTTKEVEQVYHLYADLYNVTADYTRLVTIPEDELKVLNSDRFWWNRFASTRENLFARLTETVERVRRAGNPLV